MICTCRYFTRGTTPSFVFDMSVHLDSIEELNITFTQLGVVILEKNQDDIIILDSDSIKVKLTQKDTELFSDKYNAECQFRIKYSDGSIITSEPPIIFEVRTMLHGG